MSRFALSTFCKFMNPRFFAERGFFDEVTKAVEEFLRCDDKDLLQINLPQSAGKSYFATLLSAYLVGVDNEIAVMRITNSQSVADGFTQQTSVIMRSEEFKTFFPTFPEFHNDNKTEIKLKDNWNFSIRGVGVDGTTMSRRANIMIIDDLYRSMSEATSARLTNKLIQKWDSEWQGRIEGSRQKVIVVGTRYARKDFYAVLESKLKLFKTVKIPALINDKSFCEHVRTTERLLHTKANIHPDIWEAVFQQNPTAEGQIMLFADWTPTTADTKNMTFEKKYTVCDPSFGVGADYFVIGLFGISKKTLVLIELVAERTLTDEEYINHLERWEADGNFLEMNGVGGMLYKKVAPKLKNIPLRGFHSTGDKYGRIFLQAEKIKNIIFTDTLRNEHLTQIVNYPDTENDDIPDMLATTCRLFVK